MAFTTMHFAIGMVGTGAATGLAALALRRGIRWVPTYMTLGGIWACVPDMPRIFKEDFPNAPFASTLSAKPLQDWLQANGDAFFFHRSLDVQPKEYALHGLALLLTLYAASILMLTLTHRRPAKPAPQDKETPGTSGEDVARREDPDSQAAA